MDELSKELSALGAWLCRDLHFTASPLLIVCIFVVAHGFVSWLRESK